MLVYVINEPVLVFAHFKKVIFLLAGDGWAIMLGTLAFNQFFFGIESFTSYTIEAAI
jgi:hypothetical protein